MGRQKDVALAAAKALHAGFKKSDLMKISGSSIDLGARFRSSSRREALEAR
jgi:hypothetical protein